ncbi:MAG: hypothetical protein ACRER1_04080 [Gammaproteobacteria bacterium]
MIHHDARGLAVTGATPEIIAGLDRFVGELLGLGRGAPDICELATAHPDCPLAQAYAASLYAFAQSPQLAAEGRGWLARARAAADSASEHELAFIAAVEAGVAGDLETAITAHERIAARWPQETVSAKLAEFHLFETGDALRQREIMGVFAAANPRDADVLSMQGFAQELNSEADEAERLALAALELKADTPWAEHCLAHVYARRGEIARGIAAFSEWAPRWEAKNQYIRSHNGFHLATLHLAQCEFAPVREIYRRSIWGFQPDTVVEHTDAILLLWYLELAGAAEAAPWREIAPHVVARSGEQVFPFLSILYLFALTRAGAAAEAARAYAAFERYADARSDRPREVWHTVGLGLARAVLAYAQGKWSEAAEEFAPLLERSGEGGGSDEQRGVFAESYFVSLVRGGERERAREYLYASIGAHEPTPLQRHRLALAGA